MPNCVAPGCPTGSGSYQGEKYSLHPFPKTDSVKKKWIEKMNREKTFVPSENSRLCSKHFTPDCYLTGEENIDDRGRKRRKVKYLKPDAIPTLHFPEVHKEVPKTVSKPVPKTVPKTVPNEVLKEVPKEVSKEVPPQGKQPVTKIQVFMSADDTLRFKPILVNGMVAFQCLKCPLKRGVYKSLFFAHKHYEQVHSNPSKETLMIKEEVKDRKILMSQEDFLRFKPFYVDHDVKYQCRKCSYKYKSLKYANEHYEKAHIRLQFKCHHCQLNLSNEIAFKLHMKNHDDFAKNKLSLEDFDDFRFKKLANGLYQCPQCSKCLNSGTMLKQREHFEKYHPDNFKEYVPNPPMITDTGLRYVRLDNGMFQCPKCSKCYSTNRTETEHFVSHCTGIPRNPWESTETDDRFILLDNGMFQCPKCSRFYNNNKKEQEHFRFKCAKFINAAQNKKSKANEERSPALSSNEDESGIRVKRKTPRKKFECDNCDNTFSDRVTLGIHQKYTCHTLQSQDIKECDNEQDYPVWKQQKTFGQKLKELKEVILSSSVQCAFCPDTFQTISDLNVHVESEHNINKVKVEPCESIPEDAVPLPAVFLDSNEIKTEADIKEEPLCDPLDGQEIKTEIEIKEEPEEPLYNPIDYL